MLPFALNIAAYDMKLCVKNKLAAHTHTHISLCMHDV